MENERERVSCEIKIRVLEMKIEYMEDQIQDLNKTIYNDGQGMVFDVRQLKHEKATSSARWAAVISVLSVLIALMTFLMQILEK